MVCLGRCLSGMEQNQSHLPQLSAGDAAKEGDKTMSRCNCPCCVSSECPAADELSTEKAAREKAEQRAETAEKLADERGRACVEMRASAHWFDFAHLNAVLDGKIKLSGDAVRDLQYVYTALMKSDAGRDYIHKSKLDAALEALKTLLPFVIRMHCRAACHPSCAYCKALTAAEHVLKENQNENHETTKG